VLGNAFKVEQLNRASTGFQHNRETDALAGRVREIAKSALNMSELELDEFFDHDASTHHVVSIHTSNKHGATPCWFCMDGQPILTQCSLTRTFPFYD
jgi:hypothetical protein